MYIGAKKPQSEILQAVLLKMTILVCRIYNRKNPGNQCLIFEEFIYIMKQKLVDNDGDQMLS